MSEWGRMLERVLHDPGIVRRIAAAEAGAVMLSAPHPVLADPSHHRYPFEFFLCTQAFGIETCATFERLFAAKNDWQRRDAAFYSCSLRDATIELPARLLDSVLGRMREITTLPLTDTVQVTAQQVEPGQAIGVHSDRPMLGYEFARLVLHLNDGWRPEHGGVLQLHESPDRPAVVRLEPNYDVGFGFVLHEDSYHSVTEVRRARRSLVFNFWHAANSPELGDAVRTLFADMHFSELPSALDSLAEWAEVRLPEATTFHASLSALAVHRWGYCDATVVAAYRHSAGLPTESVPSVEVHAATQLADWVARLYQHPFDITRWKWLRGELSSIEPDARLTPIWQLCIPSNS